jgi:chemotaxis protein CheC
MEHRDKVREQLTFAKDIGSRAAAYAAHAVDDMVGTDVQVSEINSGLFRVASLMEMVTDPANKAVGICARVEGKAPGHALFLFPHANASALVGKIDGKDGDAGQLDTHALSVLKELGYTLISSSLSAFSKETGLAFRMTPPQMMVDMAWAIVSNVFSLALATDEKAVMVASRFGDGPGVLDGLFLFIPAPGSLQVMQAARAERMGLAVGTSDFVQEGPEEHEARRLNIEPQAPVDNVVPLSMWDLDYDQPKAA